MTEADVVSARVSGARLSVLLLLVLVGGLVAYKSSASLAVLRTAAETGVFRPRALAVFTGPAGADTILSRSAAYLRVVWPALVFGILIAAAVRAIVSPAWIAARLGGRPVRAQLAGAIAGAPLMLCSCCVAPIFTSVYDRCRRLAPSLAVMLGAPLLNPGALALTFIFFAPVVAWTRLGLALAAVVAGTLIAAGMSPSSMTVSRRTPVHSEDEMPLSLAFLRACFHVTLQTLPLLLVGIVMSMAIVDRLALQSTSWPAATSTTIAIAGLIAVPIALPTFFEVPLALTLVGAGAPTGAAVAVLFAGPAVNLPSLLTIARSAGWKVSVSVAAIVWTLAVAGGLLVQAVVG